MEFEAACIDGGKKVLTQPWNQYRQRPETRDEETHQEYAPVMQSKPQKALIPLAESVKGSFETLLQSDEWIATVPSFRTRLLMPQ
jgi:hypothetical protein